MAKSAFLRVVGQHWLKPIAFWLLAAPGIWLAWQWGSMLTGQPHELGFNPIETTHRFLGDTALRILLITLMVTPVRDITRWLPIMKIRRRIGLAAFWYALAHVLAYLGLDLYVAAGFSVPGAFDGLWDDVVERIYITLGMTAFVLLIPLALTSFNAMIRALGTRNWQRLHWLIYPLAIIAVFHHGFMVKGFQLMPWIHGSILFVLLAYRVVKSARPRSRTSAAAS